MTETIGGYEVLSRLASGAGSDVFSAQVPALPDGAGGLMPTVGGRDGEPRGLSAGEPVVLKVLAEGRSNADEVVALDSVASEHVVGLRDIAELDDGRIALVLEALEPATLGDLLFGRPRLDAGEAVTILICVARGLGDLHAAGWTHGAVGAASVLFRTDGAPVIIGLGSASRITTAGVSIDRAALARLVDALLPDLATDVRRLLAADADLHDVAERLFEHAAPAPVRRGSEVGGAPRHRRGNAHEPLTLPGRGIAVQTMTGAQVTEHPAAQEASRPAGRWPWSRARVARRQRETDLPQLVRTSDPSWREERPPHPETRAQPAESSRTLVLARLAEVLRSVRPRFWAWGAAGAAALLVAVLVIPTDTPASGIVEAPGPAPSAVLLEPADAAVIAALVGDDPAAAALALIERRSQCLATASAECVSETAQSGSAQEAADLAAIENGSAGTAIVADGEARVQRLGDSALVTFASAALLLVRTDQGWRLRDRFTAAG